MPHDNLRTVRGSRTAQFGVLAARQTIAPAAVWAKCRSQAGGFSHRCGGNVPMPETPAATHEATQLNPQHAGALRGETTPSSPKRWPGRDLGRARKFAIF